MTSDEKRILAKAQKLNFWNSQKLFYCVGKTHQRQWSLKRGEVYFVNLGENVGSEENKIRPVVILQANRYNFHSPVFIGAVISSTNVTMPDFQVPITGNYTYIDDNGLTQQLRGTILLNQIRTLAKERIVSTKVCTLSEMAQVDIRLLNVLGLSKMVSTRDHTIHSLRGKVKYLTAQLHQK